MNQIKYINNYYVYVWQTTWAQFFCPNYFYILDHKKIIKIIIEW
jgi:uncharacterized protein YhbP (UPF0306 family)